MSTLGWIGLGEIGLPMARRLLAAGHTLNVWARRAESMTPLLSQGAVAMASPSMLADHSEAVLLCLTDGAAVEEIVSAPGGIASRKNRGGLIVDHSTIHPDQCRALAQRLRETCGMQWLDAPVSGGQLGAQQGALSIMIGGDNEWVAKATPWLSAYARKITHVGSLGAGLIAKSCNQAVVSAAIAAWAETVAYGERCGVDMRRVAEAVAGGWADSPIREQLVPQMLSGKFNAHSAKNMLKDMQIVADIARSVGASMPLQQEVMARFQQLLDAGLDGNGPAGLVQLYRRRG